MKKLILFIILTVCTSFTIDGIDSLNLSSVIFPEKIIKEDTVSNFNIHVSGVEYSRYINGKQYNKENRNTDTKYSIDLNDSIVTVNFSDGSYVVFDSVDIVVKNKIYEVSYFDNDGMGNASYLYSTIIVDTELNKVDYIERNLDYVDDYNRYKFTDFKLGVK